MSYAIDNLFWSLSYLENAVFATPLEGEVRAKLLDLYRSNQALLSGLYPPERCAPLVAALEENNRCFVDYVDQLLRGSGEAEQTRARWRETGRRMAALLSELNPYWRTAEWDAMICHETDLLDTIATSMRTRNYGAFVNMTPLCRRLALDMSNYLYLGVVQGR
jgi:hypothetical protein